MKISSFNVTDVGYHYIGLRVLAGMPAATRDEQTQTVSRSVLKYARDKALRLNLPEPKSNYETVGEKVCLELGHFEFADAPRNKGYELTVAGKNALSLLNEKKFIELRRLMVSVHLQTYSNLYAVVHTHIALGEILSPVVEAAKSTDPKYIAGLLRPAFEDEADELAPKILNEYKGRSAKAIEDFMRERILEKLIPGEKLGVPLFRAMCDRLISMRILNIMKTETKAGEFSKSYSPCTEGGKCNMPWHQPLPVTVPTVGRYTIHLSEPDMTNPEVQKSFFEALVSVFGKLQDQAGYFDIPDTRDAVCEQLLIPEAAFDEGVNALLDMKKPPVTVGLTYDRITSRRKPLVRTSADSSQIFNLIARA